MLSETTLLIVKGINLYHEDEDLVCFLL